MFARRRRSKAPLFLGAVAIAGTAALLGGAGDDDRSTGAKAAPPAAIQGAPLDPSGGSAAARMASPAAAAALGSIDLDKISRDGDVYTAPTADGRRAVLTLDPKLQTLAEKLLNQSRAPRGAIVAMAPDGRILALAGRRAAEDTGSLDGTFDWRLATEVWAPAASVFKLVTATALVRAGVEPDGKVCYHGGVRSVLEHNLQDDKRDSRCETLEYGVAHSQNAIMGKLAFQKLQPKALDAEARRLGWTNRLTGELVGMAGELALPETHDLQFARAAAGFTGAKLSAVGGALVAATFADDGKQPAPRLIASIDGKPVPAPAARRAITEDTARAVARMMVSTCEGGSAAKTFRGGKIKVAGKTGTLTQTEPFYMEHSWFVGFAPADRPEIVVSVVLGNPESWHLRGHEAAKRMIDRALRGEQSDEGERGRRRRPKS
ncbi:MAG: penicillin-binding transpeptidase domain-containing protein [Kofleriaceae bacterium]